MIDDLMDEPDYDEGPAKCDDHKADQPVCFHCHHETAGESCGFCGNDLCPACFEMGGGFCGAEHMQEQIDAYEDEVYPVRSHKEREDRMRHRKARDELKMLGVLPPCQK